MAYRIAIGECVDCGHKWAELAGERDCCFLCDSKDLRKPLYIGQVREAYNSLSPDDEDYAARLPLLEKLYFDNVPLVLDRAKETFAKVSPIYEGGGRSDRVLSRLIFCFLAFEELGLHEAAASAGNMVGLA